jgi:hypothetical protein
MISASRGAECSRFSIQAQRAPTLACAQGTGVQRSNSVCQLQLLPVQAQLDTWQVQQMLRGSLLLGVFYSALRHAAWSAALLRVCSCCN